MFEIKMEMSTSFYCWKTGALIVSSYLGCSSVGDGSPQKEQGSLTPKPFLKCKNNRHSWDVTSAHVILNLDLNFTHSPQFFLPLLLGVIQGVLHNIIITRHSKYKMPGRITIMSLQRMLIAAVSKILQHI